MTARACAPMDKLLGYAGLIFRGRVRGLFLPPFMLGELPLHVDTSVGVACLPDHAMDPSSLMRTADVAMYAAKHRRTGVSVYSADEDDSSYILEGVMTFVLGADEVDAGPGTFVLVPPGVSHGFRNDGAEPVRMLNIHAPAGFDRRIGLSD